MQLKGVHIYVLRHLSQDVLTVLLMPYSLLRVSKGPNNCESNILCRCAPVRHPRKVLQRSPSPTPSELGSSRVYGATVKTANVENVSS